MLRKVRKTALSGTSPAAAPALESGGADWLAADDGWPPGADGFAEVTAAGVPVVAGLIVAYPVPQAEATKSAIAAATSERDEKSPGSRVDMIDVAPSERPGNSEPTNMVYVSNLSLT